MLDVALTLEDLERLIVELAQDAWGGMQRWLGLVADFDRREGAQRLGFRTTAEWLGWRCGIDDRTARDHVRVARRLTELPAVREAFASGELSYSKVRALARVDPAEDEESMLERARHSTAARLEQWVRSLRSAPSADLDVANAAHERRYLDWSWEADGSLRIHGRLSPDDGAAFIEAVETAAEAIHGDMGPVPDGAVVRRPPLGSRRADALAEIALSGSPRAQVVLHVDAEALACTASGEDPRSGEVCALEEGPAVPSETARRLTCDAEVVREADALGGPDATRDRGRSARVVTPGLRRVIERRDDGRCRFPGCTRRYGLHAHHIDHWAHGGATDRDNLVLLCRFHHRLVHEGGFSVGADFVFRRPNGKPLREVPPVDPPIGERAPPMYVAA
jgi:hypothetical protein